VQQAVEAATAAASSSSDSSISTSTSGLEPAAAEAAAAEAHVAAAQRLAGCLFCHSSGRVPCKECDGRGFLKRGGYMKKNPLNMSRIIGQWASSASASSALPFA
jgi:hypothetical protein